MPEAGRWVREVAQLRKLWRAFRKPQERLEDQRLACQVLRDGASLPRIGEPPAMYGPAVLRAVIRHWWWARDFDAIVALSEQLSPSLLDEEPLIRIYLDEARVALAKLDPRT